MKHIIPKRLISGHCTLYVDDEHASEKSTLGMWEIKKELEDYLEEHYDINIDVRIPWNKALSEKLARIDFDVFIAHKNISADYAEKRIDATQKAELIKELISEQYYQTLDALYDSNPPIVEMDMKDFTMMVLAL